jgi:diacylglycerol kinase (ATP)
MKPKTWYESANLAVDGILYAARTQRHLRWHFVSALVVLLLGLFLGLNRIEFVALSLAVVLVLITEILNTSIEAVVDLVSEAYHPLAKAAKDTAAGAVFVASFGAVVLGYFILYPHVADAVTKGVERIRTAGEDVGFAALIAVTISVILFKAFLGKGTPLRGGMPSGHAATAFSIWVAVFFLTGNALIGGLVFVMAVMVSHSRVAMGIHSRREVVFGALLGGLLTLAIFAFFG